MSDNNNNNDEYEKVCYVCRRTESKAGKMISMPVDYMSALIACKRPLMQ